MPLSDYIPGFLKPAAQPSPTPATPAAPAPSPPAELQQAASKASEVVQTVKTEIAKVETEAPTKAVSLVHTMLLAVESKCGKHPALNWVISHLDAEIESHGPALLDHIEAEVLGALKLKYPQLTLSPAAVADTSPAAASDSSATPPSPPKN